MLRSKTYWLVLTLLAAGVTTACTRSDVTGPSTDDHRPSLERQGGQG